LDYYKDFGSEVNAFRDFINRTEEGGCIICCEDDINLKGILKDYKNRYVLFGLKESAHIYPKNIKFINLTSEFDCYYKDKLIGRFHLALGGEHNISNALSVIALGIELGIDLGCIKKALAEYKGAQRRLEARFNDKGISVFDDYAHHPTEIRATLTAIKNLKPKRVIAIFQPHRYTRTQLLLDEFGKCFDMADYVIITDVYPASEPPIKGIGGRSVYDKIKEYAPLKEGCFLPKEEIINHVLGIVGPGDLIITLGAGDIIKICDELVKRLKRQS
jgi:UDP-N-acetylmuramate--alanine ligase